MHQITLMGTLPASNGNPTRITDTIMDKRK
jgi:hypothetical protein